MEARIKIFLEGAQVPALELAGPPRAGVVRLPRGIGSDHLCPTIGQLDLDPAEEARLAGGPGAVTVPVIEHLRAQGVPALPEHVRDIHRINLLVARIARCRSELHALTVREEQIPAAAKDPSRGPPGLLRQLEGAAEEDHGVGQRPRGRIPDPPGRSQGRKRGREALLGLRLGEVRWGERAHSGLLGGHSPPASHPGASGKHGALAHKTTARRSQGMLSHRVMVQLSATVCGVGGRRLNEGSTHDIVPFGITSRFRFLAGVRIPAAAHRVTDRAGEFRPRFTWRGQTLGVVASPVKTLDPQRPRQRHPFSPPPPERAGFPPAIVSC